MQEVVIPVRVVYAKTGRARYISHLDTMRSLTRALRRAGLPWWYTQGFNPHLYLTFPLPLALGVESLCEIVDLRLIESVGWDILKERISGCLPPGFEIIGAGAPVLPAKAIAWAEYRLELAFPQSEREGAASAMKALFERASMPVRKKTKKSEQIVDIRPHAELLAVSQSENGVCCHVRLAAGTSFNVSPKTLLEAFAAEASLPERVKILRTRVLDEHLSDFA